MASYAKAVGGKLKLKGEKKKKKKRTHEHDSESKLEIIDANAPHEQEEEEELQVLTGTGRISTSGSAVTGHGTRFMHELEPGDAIMITHPTSLQEETRIVRMVLGDTSIGISSAFSSDLMSTTPFRYIKAPKELKEQAEEQAAKRKRMPTESELFGTYASNEGQELVYRVKKGGAYGGYKIMKTKTTGQLSREELLDLRSKQKSDRHCY